MPVKTAPPSAPDKLPTHTPNGQDSGAIDLKTVLRALVAFKGGDFSVRLPDDWTGVAGEVADSFNEVISTNERLALELDRVGRVVGKEGRIKQRASLGD